MPEFLEKLKFQSRLLVILLTILLVFSILGIFSIFIILADLVNAITPIREPAAWTIFLTTALVGLVTTLVGIIFILRRRPKVGDIARLVETRHPELKESLSTAVEIQGRNGGPTGELEEALFRSVAAKTAEIDFRRASRPKVLRPAAVLLIIAASFILSDFASKTDLVEKARYYRIDQVNGENTGLTVEPGTVDVPRDSDLTIAAQINRWERRAEIVYEIAGLTKTYPMTLRSSGEAEFTFFGVEEPFEYHVQTPSLISESYMVNVYDPPELDSIKIETIPPEYTREEPGEFNRLVDLFVPEGSEIRINGQTSPRVSTELRAFGDAVSLETTGEGDFSGAFEALDDGTYQLVLTNDEGRIAVTPLHEIDVIPDEPPTIEIVEPGKDTSAKPDGAVPLSMFAADDYGLSKVELHLSVSGLPRSPVAVFDAKDGFPTEREMSSAVELARLSAEHGDVITYYAIAWDNKEPEPQSARSDVFFIEALVDVPDQEQEGDQESGSGNPPEEIDLRAIIVELKRLIRQSHSSIEYEGQERADFLQTLGADINAVKNESATILTKMGSMLMEVEGGVIYEVFRNGIVRMDDAERSVNDDQPIEAIPALEEALSNIILVESYAKSLPQMQQSGGQGGEQSEQKSSAQNSQEQSEGESESQGQSEMSASDMQEMLEDLNGLIDQQAQQNADYRESDGQDLGQSEMREMESSQKDIADKLQKQIDAFHQSLEESYGLRQMLEESKTEMKSAGSSAGDGEMGRAERYGMRARESMIRAAGVLDDRIREATQQQIQALASRAEALGQQQGEAAKASQSAASGGTGNAAEMRKEQDAMRGEFEQLQADIAREAVEMDSIFPDVAKALAEAAQNANRANTSGEMQRAANALLYERFKRATRHQSEAQGQLSELTAALETAKGELPGMSSSGLQNLLEQIGTARRSMEGQAQERGEGKEGQTGGEGRNAAQEAVSDVGKRIGSAGEALANQSLVELGANLEATREADGDGSGLTEAQIVPMLDQASSIVREYLRNESVSERLQLNRGSAPPPEQYRRLVEEYFKNLAEEQ
ncbi:DUF4175 family protein [Rubellicoccus peritrichatus]|uniref:DUF4175 family protein n=1 Tax=Rubellicoccus peritrichatus TaxID=3080537 RepID=A0AAQ3LAQ7_9BACT|nr:DUF4175 family protein [Puniceicoccus sp. CR14]WOO41109.1 DUF4175 family protein [Puniceicoccus sp. CR14]